jgi:tRNA(Ile)-lysidine synthase
VLKEFDQFVKTNALCSRQDPLLLAVSGGLDSMVMFHLFLRAGFRISVAHANFQLRGQESDGDEAFVRDTCLRNEIPFFSHRFETVDFARVNRLSIQMAARELRYQWFGQLVVNHGLTKIATAHHRGDFVETVLLNLVHHQSLKGLTGIPIQNQTIIRPLLFASRNQLEAYAAETEVAWREDESNSTLHYERNKIRHGVIPVLKEINPSLEETIYEVGKRALGEMELVQRGLESWMREYVRTEGETQVISKMGLFAVQHPASILATLLEPIGFHYDQCESIVQSLGGQPGKVFYSDSFQAVIDRKDLLVEPMVALPNYLQISRQESEVLNGSLRLSISTQSTQTIESDSRKAFLDADKLHYPLIWRPWREGDSFHPLGMEQRKKVSDFLVDQKVSRIDKGKITVLESAGEIIWLVGYRIDHRVRITAETKSVLCVVLNWLDKKNVR